MNDTGEWQLHVLRSFKLEHGTGEIHIQRRKVASLLAYLVLHPGKHTRDTLATLFWGDYPDTEARRSLRVALSAIRSSMGDEALVTDSDAVEFNPTFPLWTDALAFDAYATRFLAEAPFDLATTFVDLYREDLLPGFDDEWVTPERERLRSRYLDVLLHMTQKMRSHSDYQRAIECARRVLAIESANERAHQHLMFCHMALGDRNAALRQYETCQRALQAELGVEPMSETRALYQWISGQLEHAEAAEARITNLPLPLTSFIGRAGQMMEIKRLLSQHRLTTLTGPGGSGKTRLAIQVASDLVDTYKDGVWFTDLAGVTDPAGVADSLAQAVGLSAADVPDVTPRLVAHLRSRRMLLVLDNCERVVDACAQLSEAVLNQCAHITILATSRELLGVAGEKIVPVPPLTAPRERTVLGMAELEPFEAARLFVERATASYPGIAFADRDAPAVASVCCQLEGMPLALELAAVRVRALSVAQIAGHLHERFSLLTSGSRSGPARQHSLRAAIDWSYDGLHTDEQALLRRLSVFAGSFDEAGAPAVFGESKSATEALDLLARLVDKSLVGVEQSGETRRYRLLDTIKLYAWEKLRQAGEKDETVARYLAFYSNWLLEVQKATRSKNNLYTTLRTLAEPDRDNIMRAISWCRDTGQIETGAMIIAGMWPPIVRWGVTRQLTYWADLIMAHEAEWSGLSRIRSLRVASNLDRLNRNWERVEELCRRGVDEARKTGNPLWVADALAWQLKAAKNGCHYEQAVELFHEWRQLWTSTGKRAGQEWVSLDIADALARLGRYDEAVPLWEHGLKEARETGHESSITLGIEGRARLELHAGDCVAATSRFKEALSVAASFRHPEDQMRGMEWLAQAAAAQNDTSRAAVLWGATDAGREMFWARQPCQESDYTASVTSLRQQMGDAAFDAAYARGHTMTLEQAVEYALGDMPLPEQRRS